jgi:superfamily II DNA helicase RecQ
MARKELYGVPGFRPAWEGLGGVRVVLGKRVLVQALSGTLPLHIKEHVISNLLMDKKRMVSIELSSNRPNLVYATHPIIGQCTDFRNLDYLVPLSYDSPLQRTVIFHDDKKEATQAGMYLDRRLAKHQQKKGIIRHYHSGMSKQYLEDVFEDFSDPNGKCRVLHATSGASTVR